MYALEEKAKQAYTTIQGNKVNFDIWHRRMGHPHEKFLKILQEKQLIDISSWKKLENICINCQMAKSCKLPFNSSNKVANFPFEKIHCNLWGPAPILFTQGFNYYAIFIDDSSRFTWLYLLKFKSKFLIVSWNVKVLHKTSLTGESKYSKVMEAVNFNQEYLKIT